jgi:glycine cleavage system H protein
VVVVLALLTVIAFLVLDHILRKTSVERVAPRVLAGGMSADPGDLIRIPGGTFLAPGHTWLRPAADGPVLVGADRLPLKALGGLDHVQLVEPGATVQSGQPIATLGRGSRLIRLHSPIDGVVEAVNPEAQREPGRLADDPYRTGWLLKIRPKNLAAALRRMFVAEEAASWMRDELSRLRDLISSLGPPQGRAAPALLDGGVPMDGFADEVSDEQWVAIVETLFESPPQAERAS